MYIDTSRIEFNNIIARKLGDIDKIYRTNEEIDKIINEALLTFGAISGYWKDTIIVETNTAQQVYNLLDEADIKEGATKVVSNLTYKTVLDWLDIDLINYAQLVDKDTLIKYITRAINIFQTETKLVLAKDRFNIEVGQSVKITNNVLDIVNAYYIDSSGKYYSLQIADENSISLVNNLYTKDSGRPRFYSINNLSLELVDIFPRPAEDGYLELIYVIGADENATEDSGCIIPDNLVPYLKYKLLMDVFEMDSNQDINRATYCKQRWAEGLTVGNNYALITNTKLNGNNKNLSSFSDFDKLRYGWRNQAETTTKYPNAIASAGYNIIALDKMPVLNTYSIALECISNAPIESTYIDVRPDFINLLIDYCIHLASIKDGIAAIQSSQVGLENFIKASAKHNQYLQDRRISYMDLLAKSKYPLRQARIKEENAA